MILTWKGKANTYLIVILAFKTKLKLFQQQVGPGNFIDFNAFMSKMQKNQDINT